MSFSPFNNNQGELNIDGNLTTFSNSERGWLCSIRMNNLGDTVWKNCNQYGSIQTSGSLQTVIDDQQRKLSQLTLSGLATLSAEIMDDARSDGLLEFNEWNLLSTSSAGEAIASADAFLVSDGASPFVNGSSDDFFVLNTFQKGGKPKRSREGAVDRVLNEIRITVFFWQPTNRVVVTVIPTLDKEPIAGQAPPFPEIDPNAQAVSVVMERNLGSLRLPAAVTTIGSALAFFGLCFRWLL